MTIATWLAQAEKDFTAAGIESARLDAQVLLGSVLSKDKAYMLANGDAKLTLKDQTKLTKLSIRRINREPIAYIIGHKEFFGLDFMVNPDVLIPRPESEAMVEYVVQNASKKQTVLDVGTGSGAIAIAIKHSRPDLVVSASDISAPALKIAQQNAINNDVTIDFFKKDLLKQSFEGYDIITANLPYLTKTAHQQPEIGYEPPIALFTSSEGLKLIISLIGKVKNHIHRGGILLIEHNPSQLLMVKSFVANLATIKSLTPFVSLIS